MSWRDRFQNRNVLYGAGSVASVLLVLGILVLAALAGQLAPDALGRHPGTDPVFVAGQQGPAQRGHPTSHHDGLPARGRRGTPDAKEVVQLYTYHNPQVSYRFVDPEREPLKAQQAGYRFAGNVLLDYQGRRQMADQTDENALTNALRKVLKKERQKVYFLAGHGERDLDDPKPGGFQVAKKALDNEGYEVESLNLLSRGAVPAGCRGGHRGRPPKSRCMSTEVQALKAYLEKGGRLLIMLEAFEDGGLQGFLAGYGVGLDNGLILDVNQVSQSLGLSAVMPLVSQYGPSKITQDFTNSGHHLSHGPAPDPEKGPCRTSPCCPWPPPCPPATRSWGKSGSRPRKPPSMPRPTRKAPSPWPPRSKSS